MDRVQHVLARLKSLFLELGFKETVVSNQYRNEKNYVCGNLYCIPQYVERIGFLIEYADSLEEAQKHWHEDGDAIPLSISDEIILANLKAEILSAMKDAGLLP